MVRALLSSLMLICIYGCNNDADEYLSKEVRVYTEAHHRNHAAQFETVTEQTLFKEAYHEGATFETVTEQVLSKEEHTVYRISDRQEISLVTDASTYRIEEIPCIQFYDSIDYDTIEVPSHYVTRTYQRLDVDGNGPFHEAIDITIDSFILQQLLLQGLEDNCLRPDSYLIID